MIHSLTLSVWLVLIAPIAWTQGATAKSTDPEPRQPGVDTVLVGNDPRAFFEARANNTVCQTELDSRLKRYHALQDELRALRRKPGTSNAQIDAYETPMRDARGQAIKSLLECGMCAARPIEAKQVKDVRGQSNWYISDASCQLEETDPSNLRAAFERVRASLLDAHQYPRFRDGFDSVIDFQIVEEKNGTFEFHPAREHIVNEAFNLAIWVKGPALGPIPTAFHYLMDGRTSNPDGKDGDFALSFDTVAEKIAKNVIFPEVGFRSLSGNRSGLGMNQQLHHVSGWWYVSEEGYTRYFIQVRLRLNLDQKLAQDMGMQVLMSTVLELSDRGER